MAHRSKTSRTQQKSLRRGWLTIVVAAIIIALGVAVFYWSTRSAPAPALTPAAKTKPRPITEKGGGGTATPPSSTSATNNPDNLPVAQPAGTFVSNHKPGQNGSPLEEASVCNTTPGASCAIAFTKDNITKTLPAKKTDDSGAAYWTWNPANVGLSAGSWTVSGVATWGQQSATTPDPIKLEIVP